MTASKLSCFILVLLAIISLINCVIVNDNVEQNIDLTSQLAKKQIKITAKENNGKSFSEYTLNLQPNEWSNLAFIAATSNSGKKLKLEKKLNSYQYIINFEKPQISHSFTILMVFTKIIIPYPESIRQTDKQFVSYSGTLYFYSPYATKTQSTNIKLSSTNVLSYSQVKPVSLSNNKIFYGPFENIEANRNETLKIHYENETPFLNVKELHREIEVSHWGNIALKENILLFHSGAKLKGSFSRYDFQKDGRGGLSAVKSIKTLLPSSSSDIYYRDGNGNISTSNMKVLTDSVELELRPRFPLFGGWKTQYTLGYNVPSFEYLFNKNEKYVLKMRTIDHIFDEMVVEKATIKVILPEGSSNIHLKTPYPVDRQANSLHYTYLDTVGRPVISFSINNLVQNHIEDFQLSYNFSKTSLLQEPILIICFIFFVFILTIIFMRLDFSISPHSHKE